MALGGAVEVWVGVVVMTSCGGSFAVFSREWKPSQAAWFDSSRKSTWPPAAGTPLVTSNGTYVAVG